MTFKEDNVGSSSGKERAQEKWGEKLQAALKAWYRDHPGQKMPPKELEEIRSKLKGKT